MGNCLEGQKSEHVSDDMKENGKIKHSGQYHCFKRCNDISESNSSRHFKNKNESKNTLLLTPEQRNSKQKLNNLDRNAKQHEINIDLLGDADIKPR